MNARRPGVGMRLPCQMMNSNDRYYMDSSDYLEVAVSIDPFTDENSEILVAMLADLPFDSFVTEDGVVKCYVQKPLFVRQALKAVLSGLQFATSFEVKPVPFRNWNEQWESSFEPIVVDGKVTIRQADDNVTPRTRYNIRLRPEMAFGTGHHHTTYMMMESMLDNASAIKGHTVMDMGCGTALLGILAAKMGAAKVYGIDIDAVAAQSACDNARLNRVGSRLEVHYGDASLLQSGSYDVLFANIHRNIILMDLRTYAGSLKHDGLLMLSGFYESDVQDILSEASKYGLSMLKSRFCEGWACLTLRLDRSR